MKKLVLFALLFLIKIDSMYSQKLAVQFDYSINSTAEHFLGLDNLGNYYFTSNNTLYKKTATNTFQYKNISLTNISHVDIINPLKIVLFYENFNTCILLDAQLNEILRKNFTNDMNDAIITAVGLASNNRLWLFNSLTSTILLCDYKTNDIQTVGQPLTQSINYYQTDFNNFYWIDDLNNCYFSDLFGRITLLCNVPAYNKIQIIDNERILFSVNEKLYLLNYIKKSIIEIEIVENSFENFYYKDQNLAIFTNQEIKNYKIKLP